MAIKMTDMTAARKCAFGIPTYDFACIVKVIETETGEATWTEKLYENIVQPKNPTARSLDCFGPYHTLFHKLRVPAFELPGSGSPLIDFHQYITHRKIHLEDPKISCCPQTVGSTEDKDSMIVYKWSKGISVKAEDIRQREYSTADDKNGDQDILFESDYMAIEMANMTAARKSAFGKHRAVQRFFRTNISTLVLVIMYGINAS